MSFLLFFVGFALLLYGAEWLVVNASRLAQKLGVSDLIVGLTIVAFGTSLPELVVNLFASMSSDTGDLAIGNVLGSNIANILLILGVTAFIRPLTVHRSTVYREILFNIMAAVLLFVLVSDMFFDTSQFEGLNEIDGIVLMSYFVAFLYYTFGKHISATRSEEESRAAREMELNVASTITMMLAGVVALAIGGRWIVTGAIAFANVLGVSEGVVGLTIVALGTSLPELATSIVAARKGNVDIAVGNAVGSNLFNIFWVLGLSALITPLAFTNDLLADAAINIGVAILLFASMAFGRYRHQISRSESYVFVGCYIAYLAFVIIRAA